jgi:uncharacterized membrane protein YeaQ/YmgE (transglycosylase-associated protein family)
MEFIWAIIIGLIAGAIAKLIMPGKDPGGFIITALLGIAGSLLATFVGRMLGWYDGNDGAGIIGAIIGALVILGIYRMVARRNTTPVP